MKWLLAPALAAALAACSFDSPFAGKRAAEKLEALPPPSDIGDDPAAPPTAPPATPSSAQSPPTAAEAPATQPALPPQGARLLPDSTAPGLEWHAILDGNAVEVELVDATSHYRVEKVTLTGPGGVEIASGPLTRKVERSYGYGPGGYPPGGIGVDVFGGSSTGVGVSVGTATHFGGPAYNLARNTHTRTRIALTDPAAYRSDAKAWKIAVELIDSAGETSLVEIPAPPP
jgi:hypothetical protein